MDQHFNGIPVAWAITESGRAEDIADWLKKLRSKALSQQPDWSPNAVLVDDSDAEIKAIRYMHKLVSLESAHFLRLRVLISTTYGFPKNIG